MKQTKIIMGMPVTVEIVGGSVDSAIQSTFDYFMRVDARFSTYKPESEISQINNGLPRSKWSKQMEAVLTLCEETKNLTHGYFDIYHEGKLDPSGLVKGWAIHNAAAWLKDEGVRNFYIEAGGDVQVNGANHEGEPWEVGIRNPFNLDEIIKVLRLTTEGVATSGTYIRGEHIYNPLVHNLAVNDVKSVSVVGPNIYEADRYATAAFAMGEKGIAFIDSVSGLEGYMVNKHQIATSTQGFNRYVVKNV